MRKSALILLAIGLIVGGVTLAVFADTRGAITILSDADFTAENGVVSGSGTEDDPYVIAGWEIEVGEGGFYGVRIENVDAHFVLRGLVIHGAGDPAGAAMRIGFSSGGRIEGCTITESVNGIEIVSSTGIRIERCVLYVTGRGLRVLGETPEEYRLDIDDSNLLNGSPILYYYGLDGETIDGFETTHMTIADSRNVTVSNNEVVNGDGIELAFVTDSIVERNSVHRKSPVLTDHGILLYRSDRNTIRQNGVWNNRLAGIQLALSSENTIEGNSLYANDTGIRLVGSDSNTIKENDLFANVTAIFLTGGATGNTILGNVIYHENTKEGISLEVATGNRIEKNGLTDCEIGIVLLSGASGNMVVANTIVAGSYGISVSGSSNDIEDNLLAQQTRGIIFPETYGRTMTRDNVIRGNVFADNSHHVYLNIDSTGNRLSENAFLGDSVSLVFDHGTGNMWTVGGVGNYWGDTPIPDEDEDGIGDTPVTIYPAVVEDTAPLVGIDPASAGVGILSTIEKEEVLIEVPNGDPVRITVLRADEGYERWVGFRGFPADLLSGFPGILFVFAEEEERRFTMATVLFDLDVAFFDKEGDLVGVATMTANREDLYTADGPFKYAIELPAGTLSDLSIGEGARLLVPPG